MSRAAVLNALVAAVALDSRFKVVERCDIPVLTQKLPCAQVYYEGDEGTGDRPLSENRAYRFGIRIYVNLLASLERSQDELLALVDELDTNLETARALTSRAEVVGRFDGAMDGVKFAENGPNLLEYSLSVRVEIKPVRSVVLTSGSTTATITDLKSESIPVVAPPLEHLSAADGLISYAQEVPELRRVSGSVATVAEAQQLATWCAADTELTYEDLDGNETYGWRIAGGPVPRIERSMKPSGGYDVDITLWRVS